jgi:hypothetical protein
MIALYQRHYFARYRALADLIPCRAEVLELCCGPGILYRRYLRQKNVQYHGVDINERFIRDLVDRGISAETWDLRSARPLPPAEYVIMQASLYHFLPDASWMLDRMLEAAHKTVIVAEPIRNLTCSRLKFVARLSHRLTDPGNGSQAKRFGESELDELMVLHGELLRRKFLVPGGREKVYVFEKGIGKQ